MPKELYIFDFSFGTKEVYSFIKENYNREVLSKVRFVSDKEVRHQTRHSLFNLGIKRKISVLLEIGFWDFLKTLTLKNGVVFADHFSDNFSKLFQEMIFINHGWGTKKVPGNNEVKDFRLMSRYNNILKLSSTIICLSDFDESYFLRNPSLDLLKRPKFLPLGLPRNDFLVENIANNEFKERILREFNLKSNDRIILYAPTHRETTENNQKTLSRILRELDIIDKYLDYDNIKILFRPHYFQESLENEISRYKNIFYVGFEKFKDPRPLMLGSDALLTDYSSIFVDYLLLQRPIIFYPFDLKEYDNLRGLVIDFRNNIQTPGPKITKLLDIIELSSEDFKDYDLKKSAHFFHKHIDNRATERVANFLISKVLGSE